MIAETIRCGGYDEESLGHHVATKLNVLHLHASDFCRFGVESKIYPNLTEALTRYSCRFLFSKRCCRSCEIRWLIEVSVLFLNSTSPDTVEDLCPYSRRTVLCEPKSDTKNQLHGTSGTYEVLHNVLGEMSKLFPDNVFNIGSDETSAKEIAHRMMCSHWSVVC